MSRFGNCCAGLKDALSGEFEHLFREEDNGVLYLTVGYIMTPDGPGWFDTAVFYCPFCGTKIQDEAEVAALARVH